MKEYEQGFSLPEILITLAIIGIVAVLTIPGIVSKYNEIVTVSKVKETYAILSQAEKRWEEELDCVGDILACQSNYSIYDRKFLDDLMKHIKVLDYAYLLDTNSKNKKKWIADSTRRLDGNKATYQGVIKSFQVQNAILLNNGVSVGLENEYNSGEVNIWLDVNNSLPPNRVGIDVFPMAFGAYRNEYYKGVNPYHAENNELSDDGGLCATRNGNICSPDDGRSPTAYILKHNKVFDIRDLGYKK